MMQARVNVWLLLLCITLSCASPVRQLSWLEGDWVMQRPNGTFRMETWRQTGRHQFVGKGLKVSGQDTIVLERIKWEYDKPNMWYEPTVPDQNNGLPVSFRMVKQEADHIVFENAKHDFPQRILYSYHPSKWKTEKDSLHVRVESLDGEGIDFRFERISPPLKK